MNPENFHVLLDLPGASPRLRQLAADFAREVHSTWPDIAERYPLPESLLQRAGATGVAGIGIDAVYGGQGGGCVDICACAAEIAFWSRSPGLAMSLFVHQLTACCSLGSFASPEQKEEYLPRIAAGLMTVAQAASEPETGGSPKHMKTRAEKNGGGWVLRGDKTHVTNGPLAGLFITLAVTGEKDGKKAFSAFLVPAAAKGLQVREIGPLSFLRPAPHGAVRFNAVQLSDRDLLGEEGTALDGLSRRFVALEDVLMAGFLAGGLAALLMCLCRDIARAEHPAPEKQRLVGRLQAGVSAFANLASAGAGRTDTPDFVRRSQLLGRAVRELALFTLSLLREAAQNVPLARETETLFTDLEKSLTIRGKLAALREESAGKALLSG